MNKIKPNVCQIVKRCALFLILLSVVGCGTAQLPNNTSNRPVTQSQTENNWQDELKTSFRTNYGLAVKNHAVVMQEKYPVIVQDLLNMTLIRSNGDEVRFNMKKDIYFTLAHTTHSPLTIYSILSTSNFEIENNPIPLDKLETYLVVVENAIVGIGNTTHLTQPQKTRIHTMLTITQRYISIVLQNRNTTKSQFQTYARQVLPFIKLNLEDGAREQLNQFYAQMYQWKRMFPEENWADLRVVVMGFHQARDLYALKLFYQWLLKEPEFEVKVVYAEYQFSIFGNNSVEAKRLALELLTKVDLDKEPSLFIFGNETQLQKDVMGPAAQEILKGWGTSNWPNSQERE